MNFWFTSDYHLGNKNIIKYCNRPFKSLEHMNEAIIKNHNMRVKPEDTVFHLGDFCFKNSSDVRGEGVKVNAEQWEEQLNGKIIHVRGNHDRNNSTKTIIEGLLIKYHKRLVYCVHKPIHYNSNYEINFVGHEHDKWSVKRIDNVSLINVGVDVNNFRPIKFLEALGKLKYAN